MDYSGAIVKTLTEPVETVAPWACLRGVLITSAMATWLWDVNIDSSQREERNLAYLHKGLNQQIKFAASSKGIFDSNIPRSELKKVEEKAVNLGFTHRTTKNVIAFNHPTPSETEVIRLMLGKEVNYSLCCAMVHVHDWALIPLGFGMPTEQQETKNINGVKYIKKSIDLETITFLCKHTLTSLSVPILMRFRLFGWDSTRMELVINRAIQIVNVS